MIQIEAIRLIATNDVIFQITERFHRSTKAWFKE